MTLRALTVGCGLGVWLVTLTTTALLFAAPPQESPVGDQYFAGIVVSSSAEQITISRVLQGKAESRTFKITTDTKVEGQLRPEARVTVRFIAGDEGEIAILVLVRNLPVKGKK